MEYHWNDIILLTASDIQQFNKIKYTTSNRIIYSQYQSEINHYVLISYSNRTIDDKHLFQSMIEIILKIN